MSNLGRLLNDGFYHVGNWTTPASEINCTPLRDKAGVYAFVLGDQVCY
jgi:hypothetical protein